VASDAQLTVRQTEGISGLPKALMGQQATQLDTRP
jgi:hypothetical protein